MEHREAVEQMAVERYLLGELTPELREAFEAHFFDCPQCALDVRAGAKFVEEAKSQLPWLPSVPEEHASAARADKRRSWLAWWKPAFAAPVFALLLAVIGYQNLATIPALRSAARQPRIVPWLSVHVGTRGAAEVPVVADRRDGVMLLLDLPQQANYRAFTLALSDPSGRQVWTDTIGGSPDGPLSFDIPGAGLQQGAYALTITGITPQGSRVHVDRRILDVRFGE